VPAGDAAVAWVGVGGELAGSGGLPQPASRIDVMRHAGNVERLVGRLCESFMFIHPGPVE